MNSPLNEIQDAIQRYVNRLLFDLNRELEDTIPKELEAVLPYIRKAIEKRIIQFEDELPTSSCSSGEAFIPPIASKECAKNLLEEKKLPEGSFCTTIMKSGARAGQMCMKPAINNGKCGRHGGATEQKNYGGTCEMIMKSGVRMGQPCGAKTLVGEIYCNRHKKKSCIFSVCGKPCGQPLSDFSPTQSYCRIHLIQELSIDTSNYVLTINPFGQKEHRWTGMIFDDGKVIGKKGDNGMIDAALNDEDLKAIIYYRLPPDQKYIERISLLVTQMLQSGELRLE